MRVVVTGANGKVGTAAVDALQRDGHDVVAVDVDRGVFEAPLPDEPAYVRADLTDAGEAFAVVRGADAVVHAAAIPDPTHDPPHVVFGNNLMALFNTVEAAVREDVRRFVNVSSETVPGFFFPERPDAPGGRPDYVPVDEAHPVRPQDPYALAKACGEQVMDAAVRRSDLRVLTVRPSWVQWEGNYERNLGPLVRDPSPTPNFWSYVDVYDLADALALAVTSDVPGHEVVYVANPDNCTGRPFRELFERFAADSGVELRLPDGAREDASGIDSSKARRLLGWEARRSWRDYLDDGGRLRPEVTVPDA